MAYENFFPSGPGAHTNNNIPVSSGNSAANAEQNNFLQPFQPSPWLANVGARNYQCLGNPWTPMWGPGGPRPSNNFYAYQRPYPPVMDSFRMPPRNHSVASFYNFHPGINHGYPPRHMSPTRHAPSFEGHLNNYPRFPAPQPMETHTRQIPPQYNYIPYKRRNRTGGDSCFGYSGRPNSYQDNGTMPVPMDPRNGNNFYQHFHQNNSHPYYRNGTGNDGGHHQFGTQYQRPNPQNFPSSRVVPNHGMDYHPRPYQEPRRGPNRRGRRGPKKFTNMKASLAEGGKESSAIPPVIEVQEPQFTINRETKSLAIATEPLPSTSNETTSEEERIRKNSNTDSKEIFEEVFDYAFQIVWMEDSSISETKERENPSSIFTRLRKIKKIFDNEFKSRTAESGGTDSTQPNPEKSCEPEPEAVATQITGQQNKCSNSNESCPGDTSSTMQPSSSLRMPDLLSFAETSQPVPEGIENAKGGEIYEIVKDIIRTTYIKLCEIMSASEGKNWSNMSEKEKVAMINLAVARTTINEVKKNLESELEHEASLELNAGGSESKPAEVDSGTGEIYHRMIFSTVFNIVLFNYLK